MLKTKYVYPAEFVPEDNGSISVYFPDLQGCQTYDDTLEGAYTIAVGALEDYIETLLEKNVAIPKASNIEDVESENGRVMLVQADIKNMKRQTRFVKKTLSIPYWLNVAAEQGHINFSSVLQKALKQELKMSD